jgi:hypothetical protein
MTNQFKENNLKRTPFKPSMRDQSHLEAASGTIALRCGGTFAAAH